MKTAQEVRHAVERITAEYAHDSEGAHRGEDDLLAEVIRQIACVERGEFLITTEIVRGVELARALLPLLDLDRRKYYA
jgi:hypothetical protein